MATLTITNLSSDTIFLRDFYTNLGPAGAKNTALGPVDTLTIASSTSGNSNLSGGTTKVSHLAADVLKMIQIQELVAAGTITLGITLNSSETTNAVTTAGDNTVTTVALEEVAAATAPGVPFVLRIPLTAGAGGAVADDVTVFAAGALPFKMRVVDYIMTSTTGVGASTWTVRDQAAGAGNALTAAVSSAVSGAITRNTSTAESKVSDAPGASIGLFVRRSDRATAGEIILWCRRES